MSSLPPPFPADSGRRIGYKVASEGDRDMRALVLLALLATPASSVAQPAPAASVTPVKEGPLARQRLDCVATRVQHASKGEPLRMRRLDELPNGELYLSVMREVDGCQEMVLVSEERGRLRR
jgi:hypothetical protein